MAYVLTGIQNTGNPHIGNILGALWPAIQRSHDQKHTHFLCIADLHTLTAHKHTITNQQHTRAIVAACLALGLSQEKIILYRQSAIPAVCELAWYLSCFTPWPMMKNAHAFKEKSKHPSDINIGLLIYPILMAADILLYNIDQVIVGIDQQQHIEIARDLIGKINRHYQTDFTLPNPMFQQNTTIRGTDGKKMSKSYQNTIDIFADEKILYQQIMSMMTDSKPLAAPKDDTQCPIFALYQLLASEDEVHTLRKQYRQGNYGYGQAKKALYMCIITRFAVARERFKKYQKNPESIDACLENGAKKAQAIAETHIQKLREKIIGT